MRPEAEWRGGRKSCPGGAIFAIKATSALREWRARPRELCSQRGQGTSALREWRIACEPGWQDRPHPALRATFSPRGRRTPGAPFPLPLGERWPSKAGPVRGNAARPCRWKLRRFKQASQPICHAEGAALMSMKKYSQTWPSGSAMAREYMKPRSWVGRNSLPPAARALAAISSTAARLSRLRA